MKALLLNFTNETDELVRCLQVLGCTTTSDAAQDSGAGMALIHTLRSAAEASPHIHALRHLFVHRYALLPEELQKLEKLAAEAGVKLQFSASRLYEWRIFDVLQRVGEVRFVQAYRDVERSKPLAAADLHTEAMAAACAAKAKLSKVVKLRTAAPCCAEVAGFRADFVNAASAYFWLSSGAFAERHELRFFGSKGVGAVNVLQREASLKTLDGEMLSMPFLSEAEGREKELSSFVAGLHSEAQPLTSTVEAAVQQEILLYSLLP